MSKTTIIAEAGVNHNGCLETAYELVDAAKNAGANYVKFQTFSADRIVSKYAQKTDYQIKQTGKDSQLNMLKDLELSNNDFISLKEYCDKVGICFLSTPFDIESIEFLNELDVPFWKIPSGEVTNYPYLVTLAKTHKPIVMSTGMCNINEIKDAMHVLSDNGATNISLLHCNTDYPTLFEDVNLRAMLRLKEFGVNYGYSDHTLGIEIPIAAVAMGARIIEKHFTLDRCLIGPDHSASLEPDELKCMVECIRNVEKALGSGVKAPSSSETKNIFLVRKSIVARTQINKGDIFNETNITVKRPGYGLSPMRWLDIIGQKAKRDFKEDEMIEI